MKKIVHFCIDHPYWVIGFLAIITLFFATQIPKIKMDSRVEVMLRHDYPPVQVFIENKQSFERYTDVIVGMMHANIYDPGSLAKLYKVAQEFKKNQRNPSRWHDGLRSLPTRHEKYTERLTPFIRNRFHYLCRRLIPDFNESGLYECPAHHCPVESEMEYAVVVAVEPAAILIQIRDAQVSVRCAGLREFIEQRSDFPYMMEGHAADDQMVTAFQGITPVKVSVLCLYICQILVFDLRIKDIKHPLRTVHTGYGTDQRLQLEGQ